MSVGGKVTEVIILDDKIWVNTNDSKRWNKPNHCAIYIERTPDSEKIKPHDVVWWQGRTAYWTTRDRTIIEQRFQRIGYSGVSRPEGDDVE